MDVSIYLSKAGVARLLAQIERERVGGGTTKEVAACLEDIAANIDAANASRDVDNRLCISQDALDYIMADYDWRISNISATV